MFTSSVFWRSCTGTKLLNRPARRSHAAAQGIDRTPGSVPDSALGHGRGRLWHRQSHIASGCSQYPPSKSFDLVACGRGDDLPLEEREGGAGRLHRGGDGTTEARNERRPSSVGLGMSALEDHRRLELPLRRYDPEPRQNRFEACLLENLPRPTFLSASDFAARLFACMIVGTCSR